VAIALAGLRYDRAVLNKFVFVVGNDASVNTAETDEAGTSFWHNIRIRSFVAGKLRFKINDDPEYVLDTTEMDGLAYTPAIVVETTSAVSEGVEFSHFSYEGNYNRRNLN
jgi:hypothetical protein